ncbi:MAG: hypothetical protein WC365_07880 [Candidatus Babeliales bacterium]
MNTYGHDSRYPSDYFYVDRIGTEEAIVMAEAILGTVKKKAGQ